MTRGILTRVSAERDIEECFVYIGDDNVDAALSFLVAVDETLVLLARNPFVGSIREFRDARSKGLRMWPVHGFDNYEVFYLVEDVAIEIVRVLHSKRDIQSIFDET
jgi:toxin ParE1/3/4